MKLFILSYICVVLFDATSGQEAQERADIIQAVKGAEVLLPCAVPSEPYVLKWIFRQAGTDYSQDVTLVFPGAVPVFFSPLNLPYDRAELQGGDLRIREIYYTDGGDYWCEVSVPHAPTVKSKIYPVQVIGDDL